MPRSRFVFKAAILALALVFSACSRNNPDYGLNVPSTGSNNGGNAYGDVEGGPITPGSSREFSNRIGDTVSFTTDSTELSGTATQILNGQAQWLQQYSNYPILIEGHADERGTREYNIALGAQRATVVKQYLISHGVNPNRIKTVSYGKERPVAVCPDISCWQQNRRAVTVLNGGAAVASY